MSNIELEVTNPLGISVQNYAVTNNLIDGFPGIPGDHWKTLGAEMQKYLSGRSSRSELETNIESYWQAQ